MTQRAPARRAAAALALALTGCVSDLPAFDCSRLGAECGGAAQCVEGLCALPVDVAQCPSGLRYADNAGSVANQCVPLEQHPDGGTGIRFASGQAATLALGQPDLSSGTPNAFGFDASSLSGPSGVCAGGGRLYVADSLNNRVLIWTETGLANGQAASAVIGQLAFDHIAPGVGPGRLSDPQILSCGGGTLVLADRGNNRVLTYSGFPSSTANAVAVFGQPDMFGSGAGAGPDGLSAPGAVAYEGQPLLVADTGNHRVLVWTDPAAASATKVIGQPDFLSVAPNRGGTPGAGTLHTPAGLLLGASSALVADSGNNRVLIYSNGADGSPLPDAGWAIGQRDLTSGAPNQGQSSPGATTLRQPWGLCTDGTVVAVADTANNRVLLYPTVPTSTGAAAEVVLGQATFTAGGSGSPTAESLNGPRACAFSGDALFVADTGNNRVVMYLAN